MNVYDTNRISDMFRITHDMEVTSEPDQADFLVVNTCAIRDKAVERFFSELGHWQKLKAKKPDIIIAVGGCVASKSAKQIRQRAPYVDILFGPQTMHRLPALYQQTLVTKKPVEDITFPKVEKFDQLVPPCSSEVSAYLSIMEGCSKFCSFCIVPYTRGTEVSRSFDSVLREATLLVENGAREIVLLGQNVNAYRGWMHNGQYADLALLIEYLSAIDELWRIRFMTSHPIEMTDHLIETFATQPKLASHLHLPVQSGSDSVLRDMKRRYSVAEYRTIIKKVRQARQDITISSDFIVGFPGESDIDFEQTLQLVEEIGFDQSFAFSFSPRPGTPAVLLEQQIPATVQAERLQRLLVLLQAQTMQVATDMIGTIEQVLVEGLSRKSTKLLRGRVSNNHVVNFTVPLSMSLDNLSSLQGHMVPVLIQHASLSSLKGVLSDISHASFTEQQFSSGISYGS